MNFLLLFCIYRDTYKNFVHIFLCFFFRIILRDIFLYSFLVFLRNKKYRRKRDFSEKSRVRDSSKNKLILHIGGKPKMDSDATWESRLPKNYMDIISRSDSASYLYPLPKEELYNHFLNHPTIIDNGTKSFAIDKKSEKSCYMIGARGLEIEHVEKPQYWQWKSLPVSRFSEVAELKEVWFLHIKGKIEKMMLPAGTYGVYFVYKLTENISVFRRVPVELSVDFNGQVKGNGPNNYLDPLHPRQNDRGDGWREIEMGEFVIEHEENDRLVFMLKEYDTKTKKNGLIVEGVEIRPKHG